MSLIGKIRPIRLTDRPAESDQERVCAVTGCDTVLSRYNPDEQCSLHEPPSRSRVIPRTRHAEDPAQAR